MISFRCRDIQSRARIVMSVCFWNRNGVQNRYYVIQSEILSSSSSSGHQLFDVYFSLAFIFFARNYLTVWGILCIHVLWTRLTHFYVPLFLSLCQSSSYTILSFAFIQSNCCYLLSRLFMCTSLCRNLATPFFLHATIYTNIRFPLRFTGEVLCTHSSIVHIQKHLLIWSIFITIVCMLFA